MHFCKFGQFQIREIRRLNFVNGLIFKFECFIQDKVFDLNTANQFENVLIFYLASNVVPLKPTFGYRNGIFPVSITERLTNRTCFDNRTTEMIS